MESALGRIMPSPKRGDSGTHKLFTRGHDFTILRTPTLTVTSPECGPSGSSLLPHHSASSGNSFPSLAWQLTDPNSRTASRTKEYLIIVEDADTSLSANPATHGIFYGIPASMTSVDASSFGKVKSGAFERRLAGGFKYAPIHGALSPGKAWSGPNPMLNNGPHRYYFQVVALSATIDRKELSQFPTKESFRGAIEGKVVGWGQWVGTFERKS